MVLEPIQSPRMRGEHVRLPIQPNVLDFESARLVVPHLAVMPASTSGPIPAAHTAIFPSRTKSLEVKTACRVSVSPKNGLASQAGCLRLQQIRYGTQQVRSLHEALTRLRHPCVGPRWVVGHVQTRERLLYSQHQLANEFLLVLRHVGRQRLTEAKLLGALLDSIVADECQNFVQGSAHGLDTPWHRSLCRPAHDGVVVVLLDLLGVEPHGSRCRIRRIHYSRIPQTHHRRQEPRIRPPKSHHRAISRRPPRRAPPSLLLRADKLRRICQSLLGVHHPQIVHSERLVSEGEGLPVKPMLRLDDQRPKGLREDCADPRVENTSAGSDATLAAHDAEDGEPRTLKMGGIFVVPLLVGPA
mmetsp:Transcript_13966/g.33835  ORF Transcript_13966/g.33835 Transcript_13966/m.33835 type:complete len:357 (-) Transcript_13966:156-1226(-)